MIDLSFERQLTTVADVQKLNFYPPHVVAKWLLLRIGMRERQFKYHIKRGFFPKGTVQIEGEKKFWYDDAGVTEIIRLCEARGWDKAQQKRTVNDR